MPLPVDVSTTTLTFGPYLDASGAPLFVGLVADITPSTTVRHPSDGAVVVSSPLTVTIGPAGTASIVLPRTDLTVFDVVGFTYLVRWRTGALGAPSPGNKRVALPGAAGSPVDFDLLEPSGIVTGVLVPIAVGPPGPPGPAGQPGVTPTLAPVATSGAYGDLTGRPAIPATPADIGAQPAGSYATSTALTSGLAGKADAAALASGLAAKADLVGGVIPTAQIPALAIMSTVTVASQAAMLALTSAQVQPGDIAIRTDGAGAFILTAADPSQLSSWASLDTRTDVVTSVNGQIATVVLGKADVGLGSVDNTADAAKPVSTAQAAAIAAGVTTAQARANHTGTQPASTITGLAAVATSGAKADVGLGAVDNTSDASKPVSAAQATAIAAKYSKPAGGIPAADLAVPVVVAASNPGLTRAGLWIQTGASGGVVTMWVEDGT